MLKIENAISDYCTSEHFLFLDSIMKEFAESILLIFAKNSEPTMSHESVTATLETAKHLAIPLDVKKGIPYLLNEFLEYCQSTALFIESAEVADFALSQQEKYAKCFRDDGSVKGETFVKNYTSVGRNEPCPCGSGKKFKKCCYKLISN